MGTRKQALIIRAESDRSEDRKQLTQLMKDLERLVKNNTAFEVWIENIEEVD
jgi:hypothetical protein